MTEPDRRRLPAVVTAAIERAARAMRMAPAEVLIHRSWAQQVEARTMVARELRGMGFSLPQIGRWLGYHHTTVLNYLQRTPQPLGRLTACGRMSKWAARKKKAAPPRRSVVEAWDPDQPDYSGEWAI